MSNAGSYLGPHVKKGPGSYEIGPIRTTAWALPTFNAGQGLYINQGINDDHRRGNRSGPPKLSPLTPFIWDDFMGVHRDSQLVIDGEYVPIFNNMAATISNEIRLRREAARGGRQLDSVTAAKQDRETTVSAINARETEYQSQVETAHSLYGQNPFFLMKDLPFRKIVDGINSVPSDLWGAYQAIDRAYRSALELKRISLENNILASQLAGLADKIIHAEIQSKPAEERMASWLADRLYAVDVEKDIRLQLLPSFLQQEIVTGAGSVETLTYSQSLRKYKVTMDSVRAREQSSVGPFLIANPNIQSPLTKPELEALKNLVHLQANTNLGKRWGDYHVSLLHSETARHLADASNAIGALIGRALEAEGLLEQAKMSAEAEAAKVADEQARIAAEKESLRADIEGKAAEAEKAAYKQAVSFLADTNKYILENYGTNLSKTARDLQINISGKTIRSYSDAMASFEKVRNNPRLKLNSKDTKAVVAALSSLDKAAFADNVSRLGKAFGVVGKIVQADAIREKTAVGFKTGDWKPLGLEIEAIALGSMAASAVGILAAGLFASIAAPAILSVSIVALLMGLIAAFFDAALVDEINGYFIN
ncbi:colicin-like pore-forming protein [Pseudomonas sp. XS1P51]